MHRMPARAATQAPSAVPAVAGVWAVARAACARRPQGHGLSFGVGSKGGERPWGAAQVTLDTRGDPAP
jgi:hypothetical protein